MKSVYQSEIYKKAISSTSNVLIDFSKSSFALEELKNLPFFGEKLILEARGNFFASDLEEFKNISRKYFYSKIMPCVLEHDSEVLKEKGFKRVSNSTILVNLKQDKETLWKNLEKKSIRWGVKTAEKNKLSFEKIENKRELEIFYNLYKQTAEKGGFFAESKKFLETLLDTEISKMFVIKKQQEILAGGLILIDNEHNYSILDLTASSEKGLKLQAMPFLYWNLILYSKEKELDFFDLGGYDLEANKGDKTYNINKFKQRFGGKVMEQPIYSPNKKYPFLRFLSKKLKQIKQFFKIK